MRLNAAGADECIEVLHTLLRRKEKLLEAIKTPASADHIPESVELNSEAKLGVIEFYHRPRTGGFQSLTDFGAGLIF